MPWILKKECIACKKCVKRCPVDVISMSPRLYFYSCTKL
ncbi:4Fe-4S binding protein [Methanomethylovorans sp. PtaU1.Bin093]